MVIHIMDSFLEKISMDMDSIDITMGMSMKEIGKKMNNMVTAYTLLSMGLPIVESSTKEIFKERALSTISLRPMMIYYNTQDTGRNPNLTEEEKLIIKMGITIKDFFIRDKDVGRASTPLIGFSGMKEN